MEHSNLLGERAMAEAVAGWVSRYGPFYTSRHLVQKGYCQHLGQCLTESARQSTRIIIKIYKKQVVGKKRSKSARTSARLLVRGWTTKAEDEHWQRRENMLHITNAYRT